MAVHSTSTELLISTVWESSFNFTVSPHLLLIRFPCHFSISLLDIVVEILRLSLGNNKEVR